MNHLSITKTLCLVLCTLLVSACALTACDKGDEQPTPTTNEATSQPATEQQTTTQAQTTTETTQEPETTEPETTEPETMEPETTEPETEQPSSEEPTTEAPTEETVTTEESTTTEPDTTEEITTQETTTEEITTEPESTMPENEDELFVYKLLSNNTYSVQSLKDATLTELTVPAEFKGIPVTQIASDAFANHKALQSVTIPASITVIGSRAFMNSAVSTVTFAQESSLQTIRSNAFLQCTNLTEIHLPEGLTTIETDAFGYCSNLATVTLPDSMNELHYLAFRSTAIPTETVDGIT